MSEEPDGADRASKGGGAAKWLLGGAAAILLLGAGYFAWKTISPGQDSTEIASNDPYAVEEPLPAASSEQGQRATTAPHATDDSAASPASTEAAAAAPASTEAQAAAPARRPTARRSRARAAAAETTIVATPVSATDSDEIVVTGARRPIWARTPSPRRLSALYPERALQRGREGEARLHCIVQDGGALDCDRVSETPGGFGNAALRVARTLRHSPRLADGSDATGAAVRLRVVFRMEDERRRG